MPQQVQQQQLGIVCPVAIGEYNPQTVYQKLNIVTHGELTFIAKVGSQGVEPLETEGWETYWMRLAAGEGIAKTEVFLQIGESGTVPPVGEWSSEQIAPVPGKYLWTKVVITYTDKTSKEALFATYEGQDAGFGTISAKATSIDPKLPATATVKESGDNTAKNLDFSFEIPKGVPAGFGSITAEASKLAPKSAPTATVKESGTNEEKNLAFSFGIPEGVAAGFGKITANAETLEPKEPATASVKEGGTNEEKTLEFSFGIPEGVAAGFGIIEADASQLSSDAKPTATVEESGTNEAKNLSFHFGLVNGKDAGFGTVSAEAQGLEAGEAPTAEVEVSGEDTKKNFSFKFKLPKSSPFDYDSLTPEQQAALNSGITGDKVSQIAKNEQAITEETSRAQGAEQANAKAIADETARAEGVEEGLNTRVQAIEEKIPAQASAENKLTDQAFVNSSINALAAFFITPTADGDKAWASRAALLAATTFYSGGKERVPTQNDYAIVLADESQAKGIDGTYPTTRYSYQGGTYPNGQWDFQYIVNNTSLTQAQVDAINSGITASGVGQITTNKNDIAAIKTKNSEQDTAIGNAQSRADVSVRYDTAQSLTDAQKKQARQNIGAIDSGFSGNYNDLTNKPAAVLYTSQSLSSAQQQQARSNIGAGTSNFSGNYSDLLGIPSFARVATSGDYNDLTNKPSIPTSYAWGDITGKPDVAVKSDLNDYVTTDTKQTIQGAKTFTEALYSTQELIIGNNRGAHMSETSIELNYGIRGQTGIIIDSNEIRFLSLSVSGQASLRNTLYFQTRTGTFALVEDEHPVGSYFFTESSDSPASLYGGSWTELGYGTFLMAAGSGSAGAQGGNNSITLKEANLPSMNNYLIDSINDGVAFRGDFIGGFFGKDTASVWQPYVSDKMSRGWNESGGEVYPCAISKGGNQSFDNRPAYYSVHIWRRTA